jgi:WD40 repeat protein
LAGKDSLHFVRCDPSGLHDLQTIKVSQHFLATNSTTAHPRKQYGSGNQDVQSAQSTMNVSISITDVAWSVPQYELDSVNGTMEGSDGTMNSDSTSPSNHHGRTLSSGFTHSSEWNKWEDSLIAVAGSNGVVVVWRAESFLANTTAGGGVSSVHNVNIPFGRSMVGSFNSRADNTMSAQPEAVLVEHTRAVNRLVWHRRRPGLLLTASQDSTVKLMERKPDQSSVSKNPQGVKQINAIPSWLENLASIVPSNKKVNTDTCFTWTCISTFTPRAEAIRDIQWSPFDDNGEIIQLIIIRQNGTTIIPSDHRFQHIPVFAMVTDSGFLLVYDILSNRPTVRIAAHAREATSLDWHPWRRNVLATGGGDRTVKGMLTTMLNPMVHVEIVSHGLFGSLGFG